VTHHRQRCQPEGLGVLAVIAGHICIDLHPMLPGAPCIDAGHLVEVGPMTVHSGGSVANTGLGLAELGVPVRLAADIGDDDLGSLLRATLDRPNVDSSGIRMAAGSATSYSVVVQAPGADRTFWHHVGANAGFDGSSVNLDDADLLHVGYPPILPALARSTGTRLAELLERAAGAGVATSVDLAVMDPQSPLAAEDWHALLARVLPNVGVFAPSVDDLHSVLGGDRPESPEAVAALGRELLGLGAAVVLLKVGSAGLYLGTAEQDRLARGGRLLASCGPDWAGRELWAPSMEVDVVGTTGAGDAAVAGVLCALLRGWTPAAAIALAAAAAAARISTTDPLPTTDLLSDRLGHDLRFCPFDAPGWRVDADGIAHGPRDAATDEHPQGAHARC
jgi:sugar/nucleoside kinase (ribokinase family)